MNRKMVALYLIVVVAMAAQQVRLAGPVAGFVFDSHSGSIRPILGVPGAAYVSGDLVSGLEWASVSPDGDTALALKDGALYALRGLKDFDVSWRAIDGAVPQPSLAAWSRDGSAAAVYSPASNSVQVIADLRAAPAAGPPIEVAGVEGRVCALALEGSQRVVAGIESEAAGGVYLLGESGPKLLARASRPAALAVAANGRDLLLADSAGRQILEIQDFAGESKPVVVADEAAGVSDPVGLAVSADGKTLFTVSGEGKSVDVYDLTARMLSARIGLDTEPSILQALPAGSLYLLNSFGDGGDPLMVFDPNRAPAVYFVPVGRGE